MTTVKLGDIATEAKSSNKGDKSGCKIVGLEHLTPKDVTLSEWSDDTNNSFTKEFSKGDVLFGRRRAYLKKAAVAPFDGICSGDITVIRAIDNKVDPDLLPFIIQNDFLFEYAVGKSAGSLSPRVKWEHLKKYAFNLPDMKEQKSLADTLWSINETKQAYIALIKQTDELVKSQFIGPDKARKMHVSLELGGCA
ncbi:MAG TPA: restriction endonuclease subunit S [Candidatus Merdenecus merdavium]|nr:restriction endonuclease subunit S [Candidatus Merdenecus merdavium]